MNTPLVIQSAVNSLQRFTRPRPARPEEHCDTCGALLPVEHRHSFEPAKGRLRCACDACVVLYATVYRPVPRRVQNLSDFEMTDAQWDDLAIPIALAFFSWSSIAKHVVAMYPGPAGAAESLLRLEAWDEIRARNPEMVSMQPDVEGLLVNRVGSTREYFIVPIDECFRLVGLIRMHWRGLAGGPLVWGEVARFFAALRQREAPRQRESLLQKSTTLLPRKGATCLH